MDCSSQPPAANGVRTGRLWLRPLPSWAGELATVVALVAMGAGVRLWFRDVPNFAPVAALALFAGYALRRTWLAAAVPLGVMALSDWFLGGYDLRIMVVVYAMLTLPIAFGRPLRAWLQGGAADLRSNAAAVLGPLGGSLAASIAFFVVTNFVCWLTMSFYPKTPAGMLHCYAQALPFFRYTLAGDLTFSAMLFGGYATAVLFGWLPGSRKSEVLETQAACPQS